MTTRVPLTFKLNEKQEAYVQQTYGEYIVSTERERSGHTHPILAIERAVSESCAIGSIVRDCKDARILDVGGNPSRHLAALTAGDLRRKHLHCCSPLLGAQDFVRQTKRTGSYCTKAAPGSQASRRDGECNCIEFTHCLFVHSIYYLSPQEVAECLSRAVRHGAAPFAMSVHHSFAISGEFGMGEACYFLRSGGPDAAPEVCMQVSGNASAYCHPCPTWLYGTDHWVGKIMGGHRVALAWATEKHIGDSDIVRIALVEDPRDVDKLAGDSGAGSGGSAAGLTASEQADCEGERSQSTGPDNGQVLREILRGRSGGFRDYTLGARPKDPLAPLFTAERVTQLHILDYGHHIAICGESKTVLDPIPKQVIDSIAMWCAGRARDAKNFELALAKARDESNRLNWDKRITSRAIVQAANIGFCLNADAEIAAMGSVWANSDKFKTLNRLLKWEWPTDPSWYILVGFYISLAITLLSGVFLLVAKFVEWRYWFSRNQHPLQDTFKVARTMRILSLVTLTFSYIFGIALTLASAAWTTFCTLKKGRVSALVRVLRQVVSSPTIENVRDCVKKMVGLVAYGSQVEPQAHASVCMSGRALKDVDPKCKAFRKDDAPCKPTTGNIKYGPACPRLAPVVARACSCNSEIAIRNRVTLEPASQGTKAAWEDLTDFFLCYYDDLYHGADVPATLEERRQLWEQGRLDWCLDPVPFNEWVESGNWSAAKTKLLKDTYAKLLTTQIDWEKIVAVKGFPKLENVSKQVDYRLEEYDPRAISGRTPEFQVLTGPITSAHARLLKDKWGLPADGSLRSVTMGPGLNAVQIGEWLERALGVVSEHDPNPVAIECDESRYDSKQILSMDFERKLGENRVKPKYKVQREALSYKTKLVKMYMKGCVAHVYRRRKSGDGDTTAGNSEMNAIKSVHVARKALAKYLRGPVSQSERVQGAAWLSVGEGGASKLRRFPFYVLVAGDDMVAITTRLIGKALAAHCAGLSSELGFETKVKVHDDPRMAEFCSGWFCRAEVDGVSKAVLTPKPGRTITRAMYSIKPQDKPHEWVAGVALGLAHNFQHLKAVCEFYRTIHVSYSRVSEARFDRYHFNLPVGVAANPNGDTAYDIEKRYGMTPGEWVRFWARLTEQAMRGDDLDFDLCFKLFERDVELPNPTIDTALRQV